MNFTDFKKLSYNEKTHYLESIKVFKKYESENCFEYQGAMAKAKFSKNAKEFYRWVKAIKRNGREA